MHGERAAVSLHNLKHGLQKGIKVTLPQEKKSWITQHEIWVCVCWFESERGGVITVHPVSMPGFICSIPLGLNFYWYKSLSNKMTSWPKDATTTGQKSLKSVVSLLLQGFAWILYIGSANKRTKNNKDDKNTVNCSYLHPMCVQTLS